MTTTPWFEAVSERINPIIVKELRQGLRTRVFWVCFSLLLAACLVLALGAWAGSLDGGMRESGQEFFFGFFICLGAVQFFIIPYTAYRSLAREREEETWVLLSLTGLGARRVLRGKVGSYLVQAGLYGSAVLPFLLFSYYLNGIDLPTILLVSGLGFTWMLFLTCAAVCAATMGEGRIIRALLHFLVLGSLLLATATAYGAVGGIVFDGNSLSRDELWNAVGISLWLMLSYGFLLYEAAAAQLALSTEDTARGPRLALIVQTAGSAALFAYAWFDVGREREAAFVAIMLLVANLLAIGTFLISGPRSVHPIHARRKYLPLLRPGAASAFRLVVYLVGLVTAGAVLLFVNSVDLNDRAERELMMILAVPALMLLYLSLPVVVTRVLRSSAMATPLGHRAAAVIVFGLGCLVPPFVGSVLGRGADDPRLNLFNPVLGLTSYVDGPSWKAPANGPTSLIIVSAVALLMSVLAERILSASERSARN